jgi:hypothetical protein
MRKHYIGFGSMLVILFSIIALVMFILEAGIILNAKSQVLSGSMTREYRAWDIIFGLKDGDEQIIEASTWGIVGFISLIIGALAVLFRPLARFRFLLSFILLVTSSILTYQLAQNSNISTLDWGNLLKVEPTIGTPLIISIILQGLAALISGVLFTARD